MPVPLHKLCPTADAFASDPELLDRFTTHRDEAAFAELVRRHGPLVQRICRRLSPTVADDAFQSVFLALARRAGSVRAPGALAGWLVGVAGRVARHMRRAERRRIEGAREAARDAAATAQTPEHIERADLAAALDDELSRLPGELRDPIVLCLVRGQTHDQAAAELGGSPRTLRRRLERAKTVLRARLERRGVVPAVAAALLAGAGAPVRAVPVELVRRTVSRVCQFPDGGPLPRALLAAHGGMGSMVRFKISALVAAGAAVLLYLGAGRSNEDNPPDAPVHARPFVADRVGAPAQMPPVDAPLAQPIAAEPPAGATGTPFRSANFVVHAPTAVMARVIASEAEYHRRALALKWLGQELTAWSKPCVVRFAPGLAGSGSSSTFTFGKTPAGEPVLAAAEMELRDDFVHALNATLPHEITHTILAAHFAKQLPRWADEGISVMAEADEEQGTHDIRVRELLNAGRGITLKALLRMTEYPRDMMVLYAQGHSLARFLSSPSAPAGVPILKDVPYIDRLFPTPEANGHRRLIAFVDLGMRGNTPESWTKAAKDVYGFKSIDEMEEAWLAWLKRSESAVKSQAERAPAPPKQDTDVNRIPRLNLPIPQRSVGPQSSEPRPIPPTRP